MQVDTSKGLDGTWNVCLPDTYWVVGKNDLAEYQATLLAAALNRVLAVVGEEAFLRAQHHLVDLLTDAYDVGASECELETV